MSALDKLPPLLTADVFDGRPLSLFTLRLVMLNSFLYVLHCKNFCFNFFLALFLFIYYLLKEKILVLLCDIAR